MGGFIVSIFFASCGSDDEDKSGYADEYPQAERDGFVNACLGDDTSGQRSMYCLCMLEKLMENFPYEEMTNKPASTAEGLTKFVPECKKKAGMQL